MEKVRKTEEEWRRELSPEQYQVARLGGTEPPFRNLYWDHHEPGVYRCVACKLPLFKSETKYESGSGWPSFWAPIDPSHLETRLDTSHGMMRTEARCARCGAHLGHVFSDGPRPSGERYCMNSASLDFEREPG
jgi:peptide-methionine (R)-S-oxide reductase